MGALTGAFAYEFVFTPRNNRNSAGGGTPSALGSGHGLTRAGVMSEHEQVSVHSEEDMLDDLERAKQYKANIMQVNVGKMHVLYMKWLDKY